MKKKITILLLILLPVSGAFAQNKSSLSPIGLDAGAFLSYGVFDTSDAGEFSDAVGFMATLLSIRGGASATLRYRLTDDLSIGTELGFACMNVEMSYGRHHTFTDFPIAAVFRWGAADSFFEPFFGYYFSSVSYFSGMNAGLKASLKGLYISGSYIFGGDINYTRFTLGYQWNNIF